MRSNSDSYYCEYVEKEKEITVERWVKLVKKGSKNKVLDMEAKFSPLAHLYQQIKNGGITDEAQMKAKKGVLTAYSVLTALSYLVLILYCLLTPGCFRASDDLFLDALLLNKIHGYRKAIGTILSAVPFLPFVFIALIVPTAVFHRILRHKCLDGIPKDDMLYTGECLLAVQITAAVIIIVSLFAIDAGTNDPFTLWYYLVSLAHGLLLLAALVAFITACIYLFTGTAYKRFAQSTAERKSFVESGNYDKAHQLFCDITAETVHYSFPAVLH